MVATVTGAPQAQRGPAPQPPVPAGTDGPGGPGDLPPLPSGLARGGPAPRRALASRRQKVVASVVVLGALGFLLGRGLTSAMDYYLTANQAVAQRAQLGAEDFRIQGTVMDDVRQVGTKLHFTISSHAVDVQVVSTGSPSSLFKPGMPVVLAGHWQGDVFSSYQVMVQHGSSYVEAHRHKAGTAS